MMALLPNLFSPIYRCYCSAVSSRTHELIWFHRPNGLSKLHRFESRGIAEVYPDLVGLDLGHPHKQWGNTSEQFARDFAIGVRSEIVLCFPTGDPDDFIAMTQDLVEDTALLLLHALGEIAQNLPGFFVFALLNFAKKKTRVHGRLLTAQAAKPLYHLWPKVANRSKLGHYPCPPLVQADRAPA